MRLNAILETIHASGQARTAEIEAQATARAEEILVQARAESETLRQNAQAEVTSQAIRERALILQNARSEALKIVGNASQSLTEQALDQTRQQLADLRATPTYATLLQHLTMEALDELRLSMRADEESHLRADRRDQAVLDPIIKELTSNIAVNYDLDCWGGIIAQSEDGCITVINTLEARFERARPYLEHHFAALFKGNQCEI